MGNICNTEPKVQTEYNRITEINLPFANTHIKKFNKAIIEIGSKKFTVG